MIMSVRLLVVALILLTLSSCGWHLRGWQGTPAASELNLVAQNRYSPLTRALEEAMHKHGITESDEAPIQLHLGAEKLDKRTVAVTTIGSPAQYELALSAEYRFSDPEAGDVLVPSQTLSVFRVFDFDPSNTVAKNEEENTLLDEMRRELAYRVLQQVPAP